MIELIRYSQDVPVNGNGGEALSFLVFRCDGTEFRVRVTQETIVDLVEFVEGLSSSKAPKEDVEERETNWDGARDSYPGHDPVRSIAAPDDEEDVPQL